MSKTLNTLVVLILTASQIAVAAPASQWSDTLEKISSGVVSIRVDATRAFDTEWSQTTQATGFVVDAERGLILTNRHVVTPGPVVAEAVFSNNEEVNLYPVYRDPVHDFGFFRYDPEELRFIKPAEFALTPEAAQIGREIRVVGNDAGEQLSILAGTLARLDRQAPDYGRGKYNDFNTFYYQAASGTSGGSSGSPVIDISGNAVALNAAANNQAASSFFLPLNRVKRTLDLIQRHKPITRGTLQTEFVRTSYDELSRLGLSEDVEALVRDAFPEQTGMLVVNRVVPGSPAEGSLQSGDILIRLNGELITEFVPLEAVLDETVGDSISIEVQRGGVTFEHTIPVQDLHAITPDEYMQFGDAVVHVLSYQQARHFNRTPRGVYIANPGYVFGVAAIPRGSLILAVNGESVADLDDMEGVLSTLGQGERATVRFLTLDDPHTAQLRVIWMDRRWFPGARCKRDDKLGYWPCEPLAGVSEQPVLEPATTQFVTNGDPRVRQLAPSLVMVNFDMPYAISGVSEKHYHGTGLIVDAQRGLVVVDRNTVPVAMGDVRLTFAGSLEIPGKVEFIHPLHNLAVVSYDPELIGDTPAQNAVLSDKPVKPGEKLWVVGIKGDHKLVSQATEVASIDAVIFPLSRTFRFRDANLETISVVNAPGDVDGVLVDKKGTVVSLWSSFAFQGGGELSQINKGVPAELVEEMVALVRQGKAIRSLETEFALIPLSAGRKLGLPEEWVGKVERHDPQRRQVLKVVRTVAGSPASLHLRPGDLLLALDGKVVNSFREVERAMQTETVNASVWRDKGELSIDLDTVTLDGRGIDRVLLWAGALLQAPHRAMSAQRRILPTGVYVSYFAYGSPATRYGLWAGRRIVEVDGNPTPDLDAFLTAVGDRADRESVRLKTVSWNDAIEVITLKLDTNYWPTYELRLAGDGWHRITH